MKKYKTLKATNIFFSSIQKRLIVNEIKIQFRKIKIV